ncbi:sulfatase-like hydrolase/transferase [Myxococcota bacterium]|nr:sulfatase-like hydrolase/transferase [Myxococcota bacterium]
MDSCRYDSCEAASTPNIDRLGAIERRYSYASWTSPSHYAFTMGMLPHKSPKRVFASEVYKEEFAQWSERTGAKDLEFRDFLPELSLPKVLSSIGYTTVGRVSMPVLNQATGIAYHFDDYQLMDHHNDFAGMVEEIEFSDDEPFYYFLNLGETHYPYMLSDENLPHISGVHGVLKSMDEDQDHGSDGFFDMNQMRELHQQQIRCVEYLDGKIGELMDKAPENTYFIVTADHGELFGEEGYFGHGPIIHDKVFEIPFVEGMIP